jgi:hypothetical protein
VQVTAFFGGEAAVFVGCCPEVASGCLGNDGSEGFVHGSFARVGEAGGGCCCGFGVGLGGYDLCELDMLLVEIEGENEVWRKRVYLLINNLADLVARHALHDILLLGSTSRCLALALKICQNCES